MSLRPQEHPTDRSQLLLQPGALPSCGAAAGWGPRGGQNWWWEEKAPALKPQKEQENKKLGQVNGKLRGETTAGSKKNKSETEPAEDTDSPSREEG